MPIEKCKEIDTNFINDAAYKRQAVGCMVLTRDKKILLQQRDEHISNFPGCLGTFGGGIEDGETPMQALIRELNEELGAIVKANEVITLGVVAEPETNFTSLIYCYFWHDAHGTINGCYEGTAKDFSNASTPQKHPKVMNDVCWMLAECEKRGLLR